MTKVICNKCNQIFESDDELELMEDEGGFFKGCVTCKTDDNLMDLEE